MKFPNIQALKRLAERVEVFTKANQSNSLFIEKSDTKFYCFNCDNF